MEGVYFPHFAAAYAQSMGIDPKLEQLVAWLNEVSYLTETVSNDNLAVLHGLADTAPRGCSAIDLADLIQQIRRATANDMPALHELTERMLGAPELQRGTSRMSESF